jgi:hypothetical protein
MANVLYVWVVVIGAVEIALLDLLCFALASLNTLFIFHFNLVLTVRVLMSGFWKSLPRTYWKDHTRTESTIELTCKLFTVLLLTTNLKRIVCDGKLLFFFVIEKKSHQEDRAVCCSCARACSMSRTAHIESSGLSSWLACYCSTEWNNEDRNKK